jgi:hypothetical protein
MPERLAYAQINGHLRRQRKFIHYAHKLALLYHRHEAHRPINQPLHLQCRVFIRLPINGVDLLQKSIRLSLPVEKSMD